MSLQYQHLDASLPEILRLYPEVRNLRVSDDSVMTKIIEAYDKGWMFVYDQTPYEVASVDPDTVWVRVILIDHKAIAWGWFLPYWYKLNGEFHRRTAFMVYVDYKHRRNGIGLFLFQWAQNKSSDLNKVMMVFPWDDRSQGFFDDKCKAPMICQTENFYS